MKYMYRYILKVIDLSNTKLTHLPVIGLEEGILQTEASCIVGKSVNLLHRSCT
jgi:hypothetical protein